jgi:hypothetical protein
MQPGVLYLETHAAHPGLVRVALADVPPPTEVGADAAAHVRYAARFADGDAALMHAHELLRRRLVDLDARLYRTSLPAAIAAVESLDLSHRRLYVDPGLDADSVATIRRAQARLVRHRQLVDRIWTVVGYVVLGLLLLRAVASLL